MERNGFVVFANDKIANIRINRESSCGGNCSHCKGCGTDEIIVEVENNMAFREGETVKVIMDDSSFLKKSLLGYGLLVVLIIAGGIIGYVAFENEWIALAFILAFLFAGLFVLGKIFKNRFTDIKVERF